jgi:hypothetical protein
MYDRGKSYEGNVIWAALAVGGAFTLWGLVGKSKAA